MTRKLLPAILALILCFSLVVTVSADAKAVDFIVDDLGYLSSSELDQLNDLAYSIYEQTGVGIFFVYAQTEDVETYDISTVTGGMTDYVIMLENETHWYMHLGGVGAIFDFETKETLRDVYDGPDTYLEGVELFLLAAAEYFPALPATTAPIIWAENERFVYDEADLLTDSEEIALEQKLMDISHLHNAQLVVYTIPSLAGGNVDAYSDILYDASGFGYGEHHDGAMLLVCMNPRQYIILSHGYPGEAIGPEQIDNICTFMDQDLPNGYYVSAFTMFADLCEEYLADYVAGYPFNVGENLAISLMIGLVVGLIVAFVLKGQLKSVYKQYQANVYMRPDSLHVDVAHDIFLYRHVTRTKKPKESSGSSRSYSSGGSTRSKGGGSF